MVATLTAAEKRMFPKQVTSLKQYAEIARKEMEDERDPRESRWSDIRDHFAPERLRLFEENTGGDQESEPDDSFIINNTGRLAGRTLKSGMQSGITPQSREWVKLTTQDPDDAEIGQVKEWLETVTKRMINIFLKSNLYQVLPKVYRDAGDFATGAMLVLEDFEDVMRFESLTLGTFAIGEDERGIVNKFSRSYQKTVSQMVDDFGRDFPGDRIHWERLSTAVRSAWETGGHGNYFNIRHVIMPNIDWNPADETSKKFISLYYEGITGTGGSRDPGQATEDQFLRKSGFDYFPVLAFRWDKSGSNVWGDNSPGWEALGDNMSLQEMEKDKSQVIAQKARPSMQGPTEVENAGPSIVPGDSTFYNLREGTQGFRKVFETEMDIRELREEIRETQERIKEAYYKDLFRAITDIDRGVTATEVLERKQEKLLELGDPLERVNDDLLDKLIDIAFILMERQGFIPEVPEELDGKPLKIEYISILHQAQKSAGLDSIERFTQYVAQVQSLTGQMPKTFDAEGAVADYAERVGVGTKPTRSKEEVEILELQEQAQLDAQAQQENMLANAQAAKDLSGAELTDSNALGQIAQGAGVDVEE